MCWFGNLSCVHHSKVRQKNIFCIQKVSPAVEFGPMGLNPDGFSSEDLFSTWKEIVWV